MRYLTNSWLNILVLAGLTLIITPSVYADDPCGGEMEIPVNAVEVSLQAMMAKAPEQGKFKVSVNMDENGAPFQHRITYEINNEVIFKKNINRTLLGEPGNYGAYFDIKPIAQGNALYFEIFSGGTNPATNCPYIFVPQAGTIRKISLHKQLDNEGHPTTVWAYTEDINKDGDQEIITGNLPDWIDTCDGRLSVAGTPYWFRIMHVDISTGQLRDDSSQYPDFYTNLANDLKDKFKVLQDLPADATGGKFGPLSPVCMKGFKDLISRAEKAGAGQSANSTSASQPPIISSARIAANSTASLNSVEKQMVKDALPYAELSKAIYDCPNANCFKAQNLAPQGWKILEVDDEDNGEDNGDLAKQWYKSLKKSSDEQVGSQVQQMNEDWKSFAQKAKQWNENYAQSPIGFHAALYQDIKNNKLAIVFEGTTATSLDDWFNNFGQIAFVPPQYQRALQFSDNVIKKYCNGVSACSNKIVVTGHSLGGGLAQYVALSRGMKAYLFNPAGLWGPTWNTIAAETKFIDAKIISFSGVGYHGTQKWFISDVVSHTGVLSGSQVFVPVELPGYAWGSLLIALSEHGIETLLVGMREFASVTENSETENTFSTPKLPIPPVIDDYSVDYSTGKWKLSKGTALYPTTDESTKPLRQLKNGELLSALTLRFFTTSYAVAQITKSKKVHFWRLTNGSPQQDFNITLVKGDKVAILRYFGEGECIVWYKGETYISACPEDDETFSGDEIVGSVERDKTDMWAKVTTKNGEEGWIRNPKALCMSKYDVDPLCH